MTDAAEGSAPNKTRRRLALAALLALVIVLLVFGLTWLERALLYPHGALREVPSAAETEGLERWWIDTDEGRVEAWFLPAHGADEPAPLVVFAHGNGELIDHWPGPLERYRALGVHVLLAEYRGYGRSAGAPSEDAIAADLRALHARALDDPRVDGERLAYHGRSLGGGAVGTLLETHPPRALILESTFTSVPDVLSWIPAALYADRFETAARLADYPGPTLVMHGTRDGVVNVSHGRELARVARSGRFVAYACGHNDLPPPGAAYWSEIERHLREAGVLSDP